MVSKCRIFAVSIFFLAVNSAFCSAAANAGTLSPTEKARETGAPVTLAPPPQDVEKALARVKSGEASLLPAQPPTEENGCLQGGEACNPLNDRCCPGYYCFGGLVPTCFRKP